MKKVYPVRLTIKSQITLPDTLCSYGHLNKIDEKFQDVPETKRSLCKRNIVYTGYITNEELDLVLDIIAQYDGVTATVVCL